MSDDDKTVSDTDPSGFILNGEPPLDVVGFDEKLLQRWFEIPPTAALKLEVPRASLDMLYDAVYRGLQAQVDFVGAMQALALGQKYDVATFNTEVLPSLVAGMNSLRKFQMVAMSQATHTLLDENLKVIEEDGSNVD